MEDKYINGRGSQIHVNNPFEKSIFSTEHPEGVDEEYRVSPPKTQLFHETPKTIINKVESPDVGGMFSVNPYQGCEHGCIYCYARNAHHYWGFDAGIDFESKIVVKQNAPELLEKHFLKKSWKPTPIMLSGNTDCYQPVERKLKITRRLLQVFLDFRNPVSIISKNSLILRDLDLLQKLAKHNLVQVFLSITTLNEELRRKMEPRTANAQKRLKTLKGLSDAGIPTGVMNAPLIPGLNHHEIPQVIRAAADAGAMGAGYTVVRLNGAIGEVFENWLFTNFPDRAKKVWNQISAMHGGKVNDSRWGVRKTGEGPYAKSIQQLFATSVKKYLVGRKIPELATDKFRRNGMDQLQLF